MCQLQYSKQTLYRGLVTAEHTSGRHVGAHRTELQLPTQVGNMNSHPSDCPGRMTPPLDPHSCWILRPRLFADTTAGDPTVPVFEKMSCRIRGLRVTIPEPRGRKSLWGERDRSYSCGWPAWQEV